MDADQRHREQVDYYKRAEKHLRKRAKWLRRYRTERTGVLSIDCPGLLTNEDFAKTKTLLAKQGITWTYNRRRMRQRRYAEYIINAPHQPRPLQVQHSYRRDRIQPLRLRLEIDGSMTRCTLHYAGFIRMSDARWSQGEREQFLRTMNFPREPEGDVDDVLDFADGIVSERLILLRCVHWGEVGHGSGIFPLTSDVLINSREPIQPPVNCPSVEWAAEAIVYTWTGDGDCHIIAPRYTEMRQRCGG